MPDPRISYPHPVSCPRGARPAAAAASTAALLTGLLMPASASAALDCAASLERVAMPADATEVLRDETLRINDQPLCYVGFETGLAAAEIVDRQAAVWANDPGEVFDPPAGATDTPHSLFYAGETQTRHLEVIDDGDTRAVTVSILSSTRAESEMAPSMLPLPPALEPMVEQRNRHGMTTVIDTRIGPASARQRLTDHLRDRGWVLESRAEGAQGVETVSMRQGRRLIEIGVMPDGDRTGLVVNLIRPDTDR